MISHSYNFTKGVLFRVAGLPVLFLCLYAGLIHLGTLTELFPGPRAAWDMDRTVMAFKGDLAKRPSNAEILLIGDSSCLMNVDAPSLAEWTGRSVVNLGVLSYLDVETFADLLKVYLASNPQPPRQIVFLLHPEFLRGAAESVHHVAFMKNYLSGKDYSYRSAQSNFIVEWLGAPAVKSRLLSWLPRPLSGPFGAYYGFTDDLEKYMEARLGSAIDPGILAEDDLKGSNEYRISMGNLRQAKAFADAIPEGCSLTVGLTPVPESFAGAQTQPLLLRLLDEWKETVNASDSLKELPVVLPDSNFASKTHLNAAGAKRYTRLLANWIETTDDQP